MVRGVGLVGRILGAQVLKLLAVHGGSMVLGVGPTGPSEPDTIGAPPRSVEP